MSDSKIQIRGNCQCCAHDQAVVRGGLMSKHGYTVENGWFNGVCYGNRFAPMQVDRSKTDALCASVRNDCVELQFKLDALNMGITFPAEAPTGRLIHDSQNPRKSKAEMVRFADAPDYRQEGAIRSAQWNQEQRIKAGRDFANMLEKVANEVHGTPVREVKVGDAPARIGSGERRLNPLGNILTCTRVQGARVYWKSDSGRTGWIGSTAWRKLELAPVVQA